jgi:hypothetical protein
VDTLEERAVAQGRHAELQGPYPGLRPFLEYERPMFFGRDRQVREIIERLEHSQFVAVLGGSGTGKSSIVRAGVIPELRSFAIEDHGDLWIPITITPGTSRNPSNGPLSRLTRELAKHLVSDAEPADLEGRIRRTLESRNGLSEFVERFGPYLRCESSVSARNANILLVLDQFEELFHPNNAERNESRILIERLIDTFPELSSEGRRHPKLFIVLTMRTEHLNDCIAFDHLPDAINLGSYLVGRLSDDEIREAIVAPPQRYVWLESKKQGFAGKSVEFRCDDALVDLLVRDANRISADSDQLPLLQHALFWVWRYAALDAEHDGRPLPDHIGMEHLRSPDDTPLVRPDSASNATAQRSLSSQSLLRASLDLHADFVYASLASDTDRPLAEALFRGLAFFDTNAKSYTQNRIDIGRFTRERQEDPSHVQRVVDAFTTPHPYLYIDRRNPDAPEVKVAHEALIRGWLRFRRWIDEESKRFEEFRLILDRCQEWTDKNESRKALLDARQLQRNRDSGVDQAFGRDERLFERLKTILQGLGDADRYSAALGHCKEFYRRSASAATSRRWLTRLSVGALVFTTLGIFLLWARNVAERSLFDKESTFSRAYAIGSETMLPMVPVFEKSNDVYRPLLQLLAASQLLAEGTTRYDDDRTAFPDEARRERFDRTRWLAERAVLNNLQGVLRLATWKLKDGDDAPAASGQGAQASAIVDCGNGRKAIVQGRRQILFQDSPYVITLYSGDCTDSRNLTVFAKFPDSGKDQRSGTTHLRIDKDLTNIVADTATDTNRTRVFVPLYWEDSDGKQVARVQGQFTLFQEGVALGGDTVQAVDSEPSTGGTTLHLGKERFRTFSSVPTPDPRFAPRDWVGLTRRSGDQLGSCGLVSSGRKSVEPAAKATRYYYTIDAPGPAAQGGPSGNPWCIEVVETLRPQDAHRGTRFPAYKAYQVNFYSTQAMGSGTAAPFPVSSIDIGQRKLPPDAVYIGAPGTPKDGYMAATFSDETITAPWSLKAWTRLGCELLESAGVIGDVKAHGVDIPSLETRPLERFKESYNYIRDTAAGPKVKEVEKRICPSSATPGGANPSM